MRDLPSIEAQNQALARWFIKFGGRRPSEAAMEISRWSARKRRSYFRLLRAQGCIEYRDSQGAGYGAGWMPVKDLPPKGELTNG